MSQLESPLDRLALALSVTLHPLAIPLPAALFILWLDGVALEAAIRWVALCAAVVVVPLAVHVGVMRHFLGRSTTVREHRHQLYGSGILLAVLLVGLLEYGAAPRILRASVYAAVLAGVLGGVANRYTKVSLHVGVATGIAVVVLVLEPMLGLSFSGVVVAVGLARVHLGRHTVGQLVLAGCIAVASVLVVFVPMGIVPPNVLPLSSI